MVSIPKPPPLTYKEYLELERSLNERHEFLDGQAWLMSGGTARHSGIKINAIIAINASLRRESCRLYDSDLKVRVPATGLATYPDLSVVCGPIERHPDDTHAITNPVVLVEVLSRSTELWDRGTKFIHYQQLPSLRHYLLVNQFEPLVEHYERVEGGAWAYRTYGQGDAIQLTAIGVTLTLDDLYRNLPDA